MSDTRNHLEALHAEIGEKERAPRLAVLELDEVLAKSHHASAMPDEQWTDMAEAYWSRWGSKGSVVTELEGIVSGNAAKQAALEQLLGKIEGTHVGTLTRPRLICHRALSMSTAGSSTKRCSFSEANLRAGLPMIPTYAACRSYMSTARNMVSY